MLFKIEFAGKNGRAIDEYYVEAKDIHNASQKAQEEAEKEYAEEKPITITSIETVTLSKVIR
jgi:hypothetical protein